jgi:hypothetical protein
MPNIYAIACYKTRLSFFGRLVDRQARLNSLNKFRCMRQRKEGQHYIKGFESYSDECRRARISIDQVYGQFRTMRIAS